MTGRFGTVKGGYFAIFFSRYSQETIGVKRGPVFTTSILIPPSRRSTSRFAAHFSVVKGWAVGHAPTAVQILLSSFERRDHRGLIYCGKFFGVPGFVRVSTIALSSGLGTCDPATRRRRLTPTAWLPTAAVHVCVHPSQIATQEADFRTQCRTTPFSNGDSICCKPFATPCDSNEVRGVHDF